MASKITMIKGDDTPAVFCARLLEAAEDIENIACVVEYKDGKTCVHSTTMNKGSLAWLRWIFDQDFRPADEDESCE